MSTYGENLIANSPDDDIYSGHQQVAAEIIIKRILSIRAICSKKNIKLGFPRAGNVIGPDQENNNTWTASATNQAGQITLKTTGQIVCTKRSEMGILILTTEDAHATQYIGQLLHKRENSRFKLL